MGARLSYETFHAIMAKAVNDAKALKQEGEVWWQFSTSAMQSAAHHLMWTSLSVNALYSLGADQGPILGPPSLSPIDLLG